MESDESTTGSPEQALSFTFPCQGVVIKRSGEVVLCASLVEMEGVTLEELRRKLSEFAEERDWHQYHSPRNLLLALVGEVGELSEIFQWRGEVARGLPGWENGDKEHLGEELSDVLLYLIQLSDICGIDLGKAVLRKLELNAIKYPTSRCQESSREHTHYNASLAGSVSGAAEDGSEKIKIYNGGLAGAVSGAAEDGSEKIKIYNGGSEQVSP